MARDPISEYYYGPAASDESLEDFSDRMEYDADEQFERNQMFAEPGSNSALRAATKTNPRNLPCPTCGEPNRLTPKDRQLGYQCNQCADEQERGY